MLRLGLTLTGAALVAPTLSGCGSASCDSIAGASDGCGPPVYAYAQVQGRATYQEAPVSDEDAYVSCGDVVGAYSDRTDGEGRFQVGLQYSVFDTLLNPFPPREPDGSFFLNCRVSLVLSSQQTLAVDPLPVRFSPNGLPVVPTEVELRQE